MESVISIRGGITIINRAIRSSLEYKLWRKLVFERDNFTCQECEKRGGWIEADHIKPFSLLLREFSIRTLKDAINCKKIWDIKNGRTLCLDCHKKTDTFGSKSYINLYRDGKLYVYNRLIEI